ncbi:hypothetical protein FACS189445_0150 [Spirochaetia bacterium]|nr:hypothetical protein FACS189445_0150 [Spirochaetia bacterium]
MEGLSKLTDSLLPIIMLIVIAGARIFTMLMRQSRNREQDQKREAGAFQGGGPQKTDVPDQGDRGFHPWEDEYRNPASPVTTEEAELRLMQQAAVEDDDDEAFSAWSLSVSEDVPPMPVTPSRAAALPADAAPSLFTALSSTSAVPVSGEVPAWLRSPSFVRSAETPEAPASAATPVETGAAAEEGGTSRGLPNRPPSARHRIGSVESRICSLPPLQQGIVWAEILGSPKGL